MNIAIMVNYPNEHQILWQEYNSYDKIQIDVRNYIKSGVPSH